MWVAPPGSTRAARAARSPSVVTPALWPVRSDAGPGRPPMGRGRDRSNLATILSLAAVIGMSAPAAASAGGPAGAAPVRPSMLGAAASAVSGGVVLDGNGVLHPFGAASVAAGSAPQWPGWNIARAVALRPDGTGGWTLDGFGGVHNWGSAPSIDARASGQDGTVRSLAFG